MKKYLILFLSFSLIGCELNDKQKTVAVAIEKTTPIIEESGTLNDTILNIKSYRDFTINKLESQYSISSFKKIKIDSTIKEIDEIGCKTNSGDSFNIYYCGNYIFETSFKQILFSEYKYDSNYSGIKLGDISIISSEYSVIKKGLTESSYMFSFEIIDLSNKSISIPFTINNRLSCELKIGFINDKITTVSFIVEC